MPTLDIGGRQVTVDDSFLKMPPEQQASTVEEIAASFPKEQSAQGNQTAIDKLVGLNGPRYQTWPERAVRGIGHGVMSAVTLPGDVVKEAQQPAPAQISDSDVNTLSVPRALDFATMTSPVNPGVRAGDKALPGASNTLVREKPPVPTTEALAAAGAGDIKAARNSGLEVTASSVGDLSRKIQQDLFDGGIHPIDAAATYAKLKELESAPAGSFVTASNLQSLRESLGATAQNFNPAAAKDQLAASRSIKQLDQLLPNIAEKDVLAGTAATTAKQFETGRGNYAAAMRSNSLTGNLDRANTGILERSEARAQASNSGRNIDNTIRQKIVSLLEKPKEVSGFSDAELTALNESAAGGGVRNTTRYIGNLLGGGGGAGQAVMTGLGAAGGGAVGGIPGAIAGAAVPAVTGTAAKTIANILAKRSLGSADELVRSNSPLYRELLEKSPLVSSNLEKRAMVAKALLMEAMQQHQR